MFLAQEYSEILYAGTAGTGKTFTSCAAFVMLAQDIDNLRIGVFRRNLTTARKTVWHTYIKVLEMLGVPYEPIGGSSPKITLTDSNSSIEFFEMDITKDPDWNKLKGLELTCAHIEEGNEVDVSGKSLLITRLGRWNNKKVRPFMIITCNPSQGWVKEEFRDPSLDNSILNHRAFIQTDFTELEADYKELLDTLPEREKKRYVENDWSYIEDGAFYTEEFMSVYKENRVVQSGLYDPNLLVDTWWDLGVAHPTVIWFTQRSGDQINVIECFAQTGFGMDGAIDYVLRTPYSYGTHNAPHDIDNRDFTGSGLSRKEIAAKQGITFITVPRVSIADGIEASRQIFKRCVFDLSKCELGIKMLKKYRRERDMKTGMWKERPKQEDATDYADAFRYMAVGHSRPIDLQSVHQMKVSIDSLNSY